MRPFHQHTLRLLKSAQRADAPVTKLFLMFNGLNELDHLGFYYELAGLLIDSPQDAANVACLIVPFPAHLMRYPLVGRYAEKPLQRFISDPSDLFRQYLRFMVETQWLVSTVVPISDYPVTSGIPLLEPHDESDRSRGNPSVLATAIYAAWLRIFDYSNRSDSKLSENDVLQAITVARDLIGWNANTVTLAERASDAALPPPRLHVIGYSLGGYLAQSVFFSWPYAIGSCTTLCSGGALPSLRTEKIIHEEEWRAITHGLQFDIESGMLEGRIAADRAENPEYVCGIPASTFTSHYQAFADIFLQDPYGTYRHRVSEYAPRLFFVVGGNDPIVPARSVLDTSPPDGINMLEIAKLSHFIATERGEEWEDFWLPTIAHIIASHSDHCEHLLWATTWNDETTTAAKGDNLELSVLRDYTSKYVALVNAEGLNTQPLNSEEIQQTILRFVERIDKKAGFLLILRNQIPVTLMGRKVLHRRGAVPHYGDLEIARYWARLQKQRLGMLDERGRVAIVIPGRLNDWFRERSPTLSYKPLPIVMARPDQQSWQAAIWKDFLDDWEDSGALYRFDAQPAKVSGEEFRLEELIREDTARSSGDFWILNCLPDAWISFSVSAVSRLVGRMNRREDILTALRTHMLRKYTGSKKRGEPLTTEEEEARDDLKALLEARELEILRISAAQSSPRYLGELVRERAAAIDVLTHAALALARSTACREKNDFAKEWTGNYTDHEPPPGGAGSIGVPGFSDGGRGLSMRSENPHPLPVTPVGFARLDVARSSTGEAVQQFGPFAVKEIGRGAMAVVYESVKDGRVIAIKCMNEQALRDPDNRRRFEEEAKVSLGLNHPNIVRVYERGEIDDVPYLVMERLYGEPLKASIDAHKLFAPRDAACIALQLAEALDYAHRSHVYHRDLKPDNVMMADSGRTAKIMDFGIAVTPDTVRQTKTGMVIGTPQYMSPDRLTGYEYEATPQSDLYSLGLILYEMLTGHYAAEPRLRIGRDHPRPSTMVPDLPPRLDDIVAKLLARDASAGYESARHLLDDLKAFVGPGG